MRGDTAEGGAKGCKARRSFPNVLQMVYASRCHGISLRKQKDGSGLRRFRRFRSFRGFRGLRAGKWPWGACWRGPRGEEMRMSYTSFDAYSLFGRWRTLNQSLITCCKLQANVAPTKHKNKLAFSKVFKSI